MPSTPSPRSPLAWIVVVAITAAIAIGAVLVLRMPSSSSVSLPPDAGPESTESGKLSPGVRIISQIDWATIQRVGSGPSFTLGPEESLDPRVPPGPLEVTIEIVFPPGSIREAYLGAEIQNCSIILRRGGELIQSSFAGDGGKLVLSNLPLDLRRPLEHLSYEIRGEAGAIASFRAVWQTFEAAVVLPLPVRDDPLKADPALRGMLLAQRFHCAACHRSDDPDLQARLSVAPGPRLDSIGGRVRGHWLRAWLQDPASLDANTRMPRMPRMRGDDASSESTHHNIVAWLETLGGPFREASSSTPPKLITRGRELYHTVGCIPCHGPREAAHELFGGPTRSGMLAGRYDSLDGLGDKTSPAALAAYLIDPLRVHPGGEMPSMSLTVQEADAIAAYLCEDRSSSANTSNPIALTSPDQVARGRRAFLEQQCANCHETGLPHVDDVPQTFAAPLESLADVSNQPLGGCLAPRPDPTLPEFTLLNFERADLVEFLRSLPSRRTARVPLDDLVLTATRLRCTSCHALDTFEGPEPGIRPYFRADVDDEFGHEARFPPSLTDVGARLGAEGLRAALSTGPRWRPALRTRMPNFGPDPVADLVHGLLRAGDGYTSSPPAEGATPEQIESGRILLGATGFDCLRCHGLGEVVAPEPPGTDLGLMVGRIRYEQFRRMVLDPQAVLPGTRMPNYYIAGRSGMTEHFDGQAEEQIVAMWAYLRSRGDQSASESDATGDMMPSPDAPPTPIPGT